MATDPRVVLRANTKMSAEQIDSLSDREAWQHVYRLKETRKNTAKMQVCFTGLELDVKESLIAQAEANRFRVMKSITKNLDILVCGEAPGPVKLSQAKSQGVNILSVEEFDRLIETGQVPDSYRPVKKIKPVKKKRVEKAESVDERYVMRLDIDGGDDAGVKLSTIIRVLLVLFVVLYFMKQ